METWQTDGGRGKIKTVYFQVAPPHGIGKVLVLTAEQSILFLSARKYRLGLGKLIPLIRFTYNFHQTWR